MYPLQCAGGFFNPIKAGVFHVVGMSAIVDDVSSDSRVTLIDDVNLAKNATFGEIRDSDYDVQKGVIDAQGIGNVHPTLDFWPETPIKIRNGLSSVNTENIIAGTLKVYVR